MGCAETDLGWRLTFPPGLSLCCPLSTPRPLRPWLLWQLLNISWWEKQARTSRMVTLVKRAMKSAQHTLQEDKFRFRSLTSNPVHFPSLKKHYNPPFRPVKAVRNMCTAFESKTNFLMGTKGVSYHNVTNRITTYLTYRMYCIVCFALKHNMMDRNVSYRIFSVSEQIESYWSILHHIVSYSNTILVSLPTHQKHCDTLWRLQINRADTSVSDETERVSAQLLLKHLKCFTDDTKLLKRL